MMKLKTLKWLVIGCLMTFITLGIYSCNDESGDTNNTASVQLRLVDAPGDFLEVNVEIIDIQYNPSTEDDEEEGWISFTPAEGFPINVDLTELIAGNDLLLVDEVLPIGILGQIRLILSDNNTLRIEGEDELIPLSTPSAQQSGLKLRLNTELEAGFSYTFILDWMVQESIVRAGNSGRFNLRPVINVIAEVNSGSISGNVVEVIDDMNQAIENVVVNVFDLSDNLVTDTQTNADGDFLVQGLAAGSYTVRINREGFEDFISDEINVTVGEILDVGTITLMPL